MKKFLEKTARYVYEKHANELQDICIILPNRRGGLYLKQYLSDVAGKTIWAPAIYSVEDFFSAMSGLRLLTSTELLFELFEVHRELTLPEAASFDDFLSWGPQMLHDFSEADSYLADPYDLFTYLSESRAISLWNPEGQPLTEFEKKYLHFYNSLFTYYQKFQERLKKKGAAYAGMMFREVAGKTGSLSVPWKKIIIAGMNALTSAEEKVYNHLYLNERADFLWDSDEYYTRDEIQEAGRFIRKWKARWEKKEFLWNEDHFSEKKSLQIKGIPDDVGQVKYCGMLLTGLLSEGVPPEEIAVVLQDEQLLIPLLNSLPEEIEELNITMGLPLRYTPLYSLFDLLVRMHLNVIRFRRKEEDQSYRVYFRDILAILRHPYIQMLAADNAESGALDNIIRMLNTGNRIFWTRDGLLQEKADLFNSPPAFMENILQPWNGIETILTCLKDLTDQLRESFSVKKHTGREGREDLDLEYLFSFSQVIHQLENLTRTYKAFESTETFCKLFLQLAESSRLPFYGEPLKGIQVMGMLETRTLDFRYVIMLSVNEGILPSGKTSNSFVPFDIKRTFGLPTYLHNNAVYAYHFYRLIQHAERIYLFYNSTGDRLGGGEKSRFVNQLIHELPVYNPTVDIRSSLAGTSVPEYFSAEKLTIAKEGDVLKKLLEKASRGLSPTSLNSYRHCPVKFYFQQIAEVRKPEEIEETVDTGTMGTVIHDVLKDIFEPLKNKILIAEDIRKQMSDLDTLLNAAFRKNVPGCDMRSGKNFLVWNIASLLVKKLLHAEMERVSEGEITVKFLEDWFERPLMIPHGSEFLEVKVKGKVDRIDLSRSGWNVFDYKTGKFDKKETGISSWEDLKTDPDLEKAFQLMVYAWMFHLRVIDSGTPLLSAILSLKDPSSGPTYVSVPEGQGTDQDLSGAMNEFGTLLREMVTEIFDTAIPFEQVEDISRCSRCDYVSFCSR